MNGKQARGTQRHPIRLAAVGAILVGILTTTAAPVSSSPGDIVEDWIEQRRLGQLAAAMPAGWPATEVMRHAAAEPLGEPADRDRWRRDAESMPSEWPASEAMRQAASASTGATTIAAFAPQTSSPQPNAVMMWNATAGEAAVAGCLSPTNDPLHEARLYAMTHIAIHDALNAIDRRFEPYALDLRIRRTASPEAAVAAAGRGVLVATLQDLPAELFPSECATAGIALVEADYQAALAAIADGPAKDRGLAVGERAAQAIVALRADDGANDPPLVDPNYPQGDEPGEYQFTPGTPFAFAPNWGEVTPFALRDSSHFRANPPHRVTSRRYARDVAEVQRLGGDGTTTPSARSPEQTEIALFWVESSPLAWNRIARTIAAERGLDTWEAARLFGLLNMGMSDGYVGTFETKYHYNFWRPVTAIRLADTDGNPATIADPTWTPLVTTPPIPDHDSGHSVEGAVAAQVMRRVFGTDHVTFQACSNTLPAGSNCGQPSQILRTFTSLTEAESENGESRILVGFHFRNAVTNGLAHGRHIGSWTVHHYMRPAH